MATNLFETKRDKKNNTELSEVNNLFHLFSPLFSRNRHHTVLRSILSSLVTVANSCGSVASDSDSLVECVVSGTRRMRRCYAVDKTWTNQLKLASQKTTRQSGLSTKLS